MKNISIRKWVESSPEYKTFREAVHTILFAISDTPDLQSVMVIKGGMLLALNYNSQRYTRDIDFSTRISLCEFNIEVFIKALEHGLVTAVEELGYGLDCRIQSYKQQPAREDASFPTIQIKIGYAYKIDSRSHKRLQSLQASTIVKIDYSLNEPIGNTDVFEINDDNVIRAYSFVDLIAEKFRALLQQEDRKRVRRQDVYDLYYLITNNPTDNESRTREKILESLVTKSEVRNIDVDQDSMSNPEIIRRSKSEYHQLADEIEGDLPVFDDIYMEVEKFYRLLPWD